MPATPEPFVWSEPFRVRAYEAGPDDRASVLTLCDYTQEAAGEQARAAGLEHFDLGGGAVGTWVLSRFRLHVYARPAFGETVHVRTWPSRYDGLRAERDFEIAGPDGAVLARGTSVWFVLDVSRRRPVRLPTTLSAFGPADRPRALPDAPDAPTAPPHPTETATFAVRRADLDRVGHANNVRFVEWTLESVAERPRRLVGLDIQFRTEAVWGDTVRVETGEAPGSAPGVLAHRLTRAADGRLLATVATLWA